MALAGAGRLTSAAPPRLLVLRALGLGDLLTAVPALRGLAHAFPQHHRTLVAPRALAPLVRLIGGDEGPVAHDVLDASLLDQAALAKATLDGATFAGPAAGGATLGEGRTGADEAVNLHGAGPHSHRLLLRARPGRLIAFAHPEVPESYEGPRWREGEPEIVRWCRLLADSGVRCDPDDFHIAAPPSADEARRGMRGATVIHPGASSGARRWPLRRWAAVAAAERIVGRRVLVTGGRSEAALAEAVAAGAGLPRQAVLAGHTTIEELVEVIGAAGRVVCGDTGVGHLATALGTPSVLLFGPVSPARWGPPAAAGRRNRVLWAGEEGDPHGERPDQGLLKITVADVLDALEGLDG